ncbi:MAG: sugar phosphate isomerase/epimerase [Firmicutes bacterium]|jgi:sugar phosphate isomerase/epimerase|nr:sugar phosphate isomerase/epimerase [Bacillota bacterium]
MAKLGVVHYNFPGDLEAFLDFAAEAGFEYTELLAEDVWKKEQSYEEAVASARRVRALLDQRGIKVSALAAQNDFLVTSQEDMEFQVERLKQVCRLADVLGTRLLRVDGGWPKEGVPKERWVELMVEGFGRCRDFVEKEDFKFALDNHGLVTNDADLQIELLEAVGSKNIGANLDTMNYRWAGHPLEKVNEFYEKIAPWVLHVHMKDGQNSLADYEGTALGEGELDLHWAVECLKRVDYQGVWCVEYEGKTDHAEGFRKGLEWLKSNL